MLIIGLNIVILEVVSTIFKKLLIVVNLFFVMFSAYFNVFLGIYYFLLKHVIFPPSYGHSSNILLIVL